MDKQVLEKFIAKYNLGGAAESVLIKADDTGLHTKFMTDDKNVMGTVNAKGVELEEGEYGIYNTAQFRSMLGVLDNSMKVKVIKKDGSPTGLLLSDSNTKVTAVLSHKDNIPNVPDLKKTPNYDIVIKLDQKFLGTFVRAKGALPDSETFTVDTNGGKKATVVLGYSGTRNTNRISMDVEAEKIADVDPISFSSTYFKEMLMANKEMTSGKLEVDPSGIARVTFEVDGFDVTYYLIMVKRKD